MAENSFPVRTATVTFGSGVAAFQAQPKVSARRPVVILLHERYGVVRHTQDLVVKLARAGYVALAPDLFWRFMGDREALQRGDITLELRDGEVVEDLSAALDYLARCEFADSSRVAVMGVCQTGRHSVLVAARKREVSSCVVFYGAAGPRDWKVDEYRAEAMSELIGGLSCPVLGVFGEADHIISVDDVLRFRNGLEAKNKTYHIRLYAGAPHGWLNDTMPGRYRKEAAEDAWQLLLAFLAKTLHEGYPTGRVLWTFESSFSRDYDFKKNVRLE